MSPAHLAVRPFAPFGVEVVGVDVRSGGTAAVSRLPELLAEHHVLVVRDQVFDAPAQIDATALFGPVLDERGTGTRHTFVSNVRPDAVAPDGELAWHQDGAFLADPFPVIALYGVAVDVGAAPTCFASNAMAYDALADATRSRIEALRARHVFARKMRRSYAGAGERSFGREPSAHHPIVMRHRTTGRPFVYVNGLMTQRIVELGEDESAALLHELEETIYDDRRVLVHRWRTGDFVVWDNLAVQHRRPLGALGAVRDLRRTIVGDERTAAEYRRFLTWLRAA